MRIHDYEKWIDNDDDITPKPRRTGKVLKKLKREEKLEIQDLKLSKNRHAKR